MRLWLRMERGGRRVPDDRALNRGMPHRGRPLDARCMLRLWARRKVVADRHLVELRLVPCGWSCRLNMHVAALQSGAR